MSSRQKFYLICLNLVLILNTAHGASLTCKHEITGEELDWFIIYKLPKLHMQIDETNEPNASPFLSEGTAYTFITSQSYLI